MPIETENLRFFRAGPSAVIAGLCDVLKIRQIIDSVVHWDPSQCRLSPGTRIMALIINILVDRKALCHVADFYRDQDLGVLFGAGQKVRYEELNDDALGRALDKLAATGDLKKLFSTIALTAAATHDVPIVGLHIDTTSISVQGAYEGEGPLEITFGFSRDHRPDLKQFLIGLTVTREGIPVLGQSLNGNTSDKSWYPEVIEELIGTFSEEKLQEIIFVADCALVTKDNLALLSPEEGKIGLKFISRLPETFAVAEEVKEEAFRLGKWNGIGTLSQKKGAAYYQSQSFVREIEGWAYRLIVVHSSALDQRKEKSLTKKWTRQKEELEKAARELSQRPFACKADAIKALELFVKEHHHQPFAVNGRITGELIARYPKPGRPRKGTQPESTEVYYVHVKISEDENAMGREKDLASTFVLITNLMDAEKYPDREVLKEYKEQNAVERQFSFLKQPFLLGPIFLKNKDRVEAMSFVFQLSLLVAAYLEYRVRKSLETETAPLTLPGKRKSNTPTARALLEMLDPLLVVKQGRDRALINYHGPEVIRALELAGFGKEIYLSPGRTGG